MANPSDRNGLQDDDNQDQIGSNSSTPSGISTPQPDPADKRLPSIMHSYLQVGSSSGDKVRPFKSWFSGPGAPASGGNTLSNALEFAGIRDGRSSSQDSSSSGSLVMMGRDETSEVRSPTSRHKKLDLKKIPEVLRPTDLPTPPHSSSCSLLQKDSDEPEPGSSPERRTGSSLSMLKGYATSPEAIPPGFPRARRHTSHPVSSVSDDSVFASHFSNPSITYAPGVLCSPEVSLHDQEKPHVSISSENLAKLTGNAVIPRQKNTPPLTPRAMSNEGPQADKRPATSSPLSPNPSHQQPDEMDRSTDEITGKLNEAFPSRPSTSPPGGPPVRSLKGKLFVKISEAKGLRPGFDPYVVCVFEWNEFISKSAKDEEADWMERQKQAQSESEAGRPMAIPMKSRQSSNNSLLEPPDKPRMPVTTDPHWNHEAVL